MTDFDTHFMRRAIALAREGTTWPNPAVGCVLVKYNTIIAEGCTGEGGRPHAEEIALLSAGTAAAGATAYISLEPCGARSNHSASCAQRLIDAKVARVVFAASDPSPFASHRGVEALKAAQIPTEGGFLAQEADHLIAPSRHFYEFGIPLLVESPDGAGCDDAYRAAPHDDHKSALIALAHQGFRKLWVSPHSELSRILRIKGLLT